MIAITDPGIVIALPGDLDQLIGIIPE